MQRDRRALVLVGIGLLLVVGTFVGGVLAAPSWTAQGDGERRTIVGSQSTEGGWHENGAVFALEGDNVTWRSDSAASYFDVTRLSDGRILAAFESEPGQSSCDPRPEGCVKTGYRIIDPSGSGEPEIVSEWSYPVRSAGNSEVHDVEPIGDGAFVLADMEYERVMIVDDGEVTWQWNASSFYEAPADPTRQDWLHTNDVDAINDTHFLVSVRNANQLLVLERGNGVVEVINEDDGGSDQSCRGQLVDADGDGDVRCGDPNVIDHQHNPQWLDQGAVLVADSDNDRVVELHRNATTGAWEPSWTLTEAQGVPLHWPRDADRLPNGNTLVTDTFNSRALEVSANGTVVWSAQLFHLPYEADRVPVGETAGAARYTADGSVSSPEDDVPVLTTVLFALRGQFSALPVWFGELHLLLSALGLGLVLGGGVDRWLAGRS